MFLRLFMDLSAKTPTFESTFLAGHPPKKLSKVGVLDESSTKKPKEHNATASPESPSTVKQQQQRPYFYQPTTNVRATYYQPHLYQTSPLVPLWVGGA